MRRRFVDAIFVNQRLDRRDRRFEREARRLAAGRNTGAGDPARDEPRKETQPVRQPTSFDRIARRYLDEPAFCALVKQFDQELRAGRVTARDLRQAIRFAAVMARLPEVERTS